VGKKKRREKRKKSVHKRRGDIKGRTRHTHKPFLETATRGKGVTEKIKTCKESFGILGQQIGRWKGARAKTEGKVSLGKTGDKKTASPKKEKDARKKKHRNRTISKKDLSYHTGGVKE